MEFIFLNQPIVLGTMSRLLPPRHWADRQFADNSPIGPKIAAARFRTRAISEPALRAFYRRSGLDANR